MTNILHSLKNTVHKHWLLGLVLLTGLVLGLVFLLPMTKPISLSEDHLYQSEPSTFIADVQVSPEVVVEHQFVAQKVDLDRKIVTPTPGSSIDQLAMVAQEAGGNIVSQTNEFLVVDVSQTQARVFEESLKETNLVADYETDYPIAIAQNSAGQYDWGVERIEAPYVWETTAAQGVRIGIVDTGIDYTHPELSSRYVGGYDFVNNDADPFDDHGHGTHVAGIVAADLNDATQVGVSPQVNIYSLKVLGTDGTGYISDIVEAIDWAIQENLNVLNFSLGTTYHSSTLERKLNQASQAGIFLVAAAGNTNGGSLLYPAAYDTVVAVSATDAQDNFANFSSVGAELAAPGVHIRSTVPGGGYATWSGTSMAAPHVTGTVALMLANQQENVRQLLRETAFDLGPEGRDSYYGYGLVHARFATLGKDVLAPLITFLEPDHQSKVSGTVPIRLSIQDENNVVEAQLEINDVLVTEWTSEPYEMLWDTSELDEDLYSLVATAWDEFDNEGSAHVMVSVLHDDELESPPTATESPSLIREDGVSLEVRRDIEQEAAREHRRDYEFVPETRPTPTTPTLSPPVPPTTPTATPQPPVVSNFNQRNPRPDAIQPNQTQPRQGPEEVRTPAPTREQDRPDARERVRGVSQEKLPLGWWLWLEIRTKLGF